MAERGLPGCAPGGVRRFRTLDTQPRGRSNLEFFEKEFPAAWKEQTQACEGVNEALLVLQESLAHEALGATYAAIYR